MTESLGQESGNRLPGVAGHRLSPLHNTVAGFIQAGNREFLAQ